VQQDWVFFAPGIFWLCDSAAALSQRCSSCGCADVPAPAAAEWVAEVTLCYNGRYAKFCLLYKWRFGGYFLACTGLSVADATVTDARYCFKAKLILFHCLNYCPEAVFYR
jgi:hypothetical protein